MNTLTNTNNRKAFSLIELLVVMSIGLLLLVMSTPSFSRLVRKSKVQQTAETVLTVMNMATQLSLQLTRPEAVVVYIGDDFSTVATKPRSGVLPKYGNIEIWSARLHVSASTGRIDGKIPYGTTTEWDAGSQSVWAPFTTPLEPLTLDSFTFPDGVRILTGLCLKTANPTTYTFQFSNYNATDPRGEIKRHCIATVEGEGFSQNCGEDYSYSDVLIFDVVTGEHVVIRATAVRWGESTHFANCDYKARVLTNLTTHENVRLTHIQKPLFSTSPVNGKVTYAASVPIINNNIQSIIDQ